jgi:16S rRNA (uracil1498-N3)-methyltransferase
MQVFYAPGISDSTFTLDERESRHTIRVLRMKSGDQVRLIDGRGNLYEGLITDPDQKKCVISINSVINNFETKSYKLHMAVSPLKNPDRYEWFVEKAVEIGVDEITPLICRNTEKQTVKPDRLRNLIISAMKQSLKAKDTILNEPCQLKEIISLNHPGKMMIAHCNDKIKRNSIGDIYNKGEDAIILIGPEGDFSETEIEDACKKGFSPVHLGNSRLRTETAGISACHSIYFINQ